MVEVGHGDEVASTSPLQQPRKATSLGAAAASETAEGPVAVKVRGVGVAAPEVGGSAPARRVKRYRLGYAVETTMPGSVFAEPVITDGEFSDAVRAADRWPVLRLRVDWTGQDYTGPVSDLDVTVRRMTIERSITGELPESAGLVDGYATANLQAELGGTHETSYRADPDARMTLAEELSPYRPDSPLAGAARVTAAVRADMGLLTERGPKFYRQLTGTVRSLKVDERQRTVDLGGVDPSERIREIITLPTYGEFITHKSRRSWAITVNTQWLVDYVLRRNGIYASPPLRDDAFIACTGHGGLVSERGFNGAPISINASTGPTSGLWVDDSHPWGMLGTPENAAGGTVGYQEFHGTPGDGSTVPLMFQPGYGIALSFWCHIGTYMGLASTLENRLFQVLPTAGQTPRLFVNGFGNGDIYAGIVDQNGNITATPRISTGASRWSHIGVHWRWTSTTTMVVTIRLGGQTRTYTLTHAAITVTETALIEGYRRTVQVRGMMFRSWTNMQAWMSPSAPPSLADWQALETHVSEAEIGRGNNELLYLPNIASDDSWEVLKAAVGAEYGVHGFTPEGRYFFRPRSDTRPSVIDTVIDVEENLSDVVHTESSDSVRNVVGYSATPAYHDGTYQTVVKADDVEQFVVPGRTMRSYDLDWPFGAAGNQSGRLPYMGNPPATGIGNGVWSNDVQHGWTYSSGTNYTDGSNAQSVVVTYRQIDARVVRITVDNRNGDRTIRLATPADSSDPSGKPGEPAMRIGGWPLINTPDHVAEYRDEASIARYRGPRVFPMGKSEWRQQPAALDGLARELLAALAEVNPVLEDLPVRGDPRVQAGMVASARFRDGGQPIIGTIVRVLREASEDGLTDLVTLRPLPEQTLAPPGWQFYVDVSRYQGDRADPIDLTRVYNLGYTACVAKVGQGGGTTDNGTVYGETIDPWWTRFRDVARPLWGQRFAGYWYIGNTESPASQAARCKAALPDTAIPIMLDWEDGGGQWQTCLDVLAAFRSAGLKVSMLYLGSGYAASHGAANVDATGLHVVRARYWTNDTAHPRVLWDDMPDPYTFGLAAFNGATPDATQFTQYGTVYPGMNIDVNAFPGSVERLRRMIQGLSI